MEQPFIATRSTKVTFKKSFRRQILIELSFCKMSEATCFEKLKELMRLHTVYQMVSKFRGISRAVTSLNKADDQ